MHFLSRAISVEHRWLMLALLAALCVTSGIFLLFRLLHSPAVGTDMDNSTLGRSVYNPVIALYALHLCKASYCVPTSVTDWSCGESCSHSRALGFELVDVYVNASWSTLAYSGLDHANGRIIAVFRGSANLGNWLSDLTFWTSPYPCPTNDSDGSSSSTGDDDDDERPAKYSVDGDLLDPIQTEPGECRVHKGFYEAYHSLSANLTSDLLSLHRRYPSYGFLLTGHSLGGALATVCAMDLVTREAFVSSPAAFTAPIDVYTFGEPRSGSAPLTEYAYSLLGGHPHGNRQHFRVTHGRDVVPHLPPVSWGYVHQPQELWYFRNGTEDGNLFYFVDCDDNSTQEDPECSNSVWSTSVADHTLYLGTCTQCLCTRAEMEEIHNYTLPDDKLLALAEDYDNAHRA